MFVQDMAAAIDGARTLAQMDDLSRQVWQAHAAGALSDTAAQGFAERLHVRRGTLRPQIVQLAASAGPVSLFRPRRPQVSPDRRASMLRRRLLAASGGMPPRLANGFTTAEQAALRIVGDEVRDHGTCDCTLAEIAARAGCGRTSVQNAIRTARLMGLIAVEARPVKGAKNQSNVITILSAEWTAWLSRGTRRADPPGFKTVNPTDRKVKEDRFRERVRTEPSGSGAQWRSENRHASNTVPDHARSQAASPDHDSA